MTDGCADTVRSRRCRNYLAILFARRQWLLDEHVHAALDSFESLTRMKCRWHQHVRDGNTIRSSFRYCVVSAHAKLFGTFRRPVSVDVDEAGKLRARSVTNGE